MAPRLVVLAQTVQEHDEVAGGVAEGLGERPRRDRDVLAVVADAMTMACGSSSMRSSSPMRPLTAATTTAATPRALDRAADAALGQRPDGAAGDPQDAGDRAIERRHDRVVQRLRDAAADDARRAEGAHADGLVQVANGADDQALAVVESERGDVGRPCGSVGMDSSVPCPTHRQTLHIPDGASCTRLPQSCYLGSCVRRLVRLLIGGTCRRPAATRESTTLPDLSVTLADSTSDASALPRMHLGHHLGHVVVLHDVLDVRVGILAGLLRATHDVLR